jgi:thioredoxin-like negative regulator of GroEL
MELRLEALARHHPVTFTGYRIGIDAGQQTSARFGVPGIPTFIGLRDGQEAARLGGLIRVTDLTTTLARLTATGVRRRPGVKREP